MKTKPGTLLISKHGSGRFLVCLGPNPSQPHPDDVCYLTTDGSTVIADEIAVNHNYDIVPAEADEDLQ